MTTVTAMTIETFTRCAIAAGFSRSVGGVVWSSVGVVTASL
jgi:hypothetical protein